MLPCCGSLYKCESFAFYSFIVVVQGGLKKKKTVWCQSCHFIHNRITFLFGPSVFTLFSNKGTSLMLRKNLCIFIPRIRRCLVKNTVNVVTYLNNRDSQYLSVALHYQWGNLPLLLFTPENSHPGKVQVASSLQSHTEREKQQCPVIPVDKWEIPTDLTCRSFGLLVRTRKNPEGTNAVVGTTCKLL